MTNYHPNAGAPGAPYPSYPPQPPSYPPPAGSRTNGLAVASLVLGIVWLCGVGSMLALVFGYMALSRIKRTGEGGRGMAIAGIVLGWIGAAVLVLSIALIAGSGGDDGETSTEETTAGQTDEGPETNSGNTENPPPEDIELTECGPGVGNPAGGSFAGAAGTITNHSSEPSSYIFTVEFVMPDGTRYAESPGSANAVAPDQTVEWGAPTLDDFREGTECRITQVERFAS